MIARGRAGRSSLQAGYHASVVVILAAGVSGCRLPQLPDRANPQDSVKNALDYATATQQNYAKYLSDQRDLNTYLGLAEIALAGSGVGVGAAGGSSVAVTALSTGAAATVAADQWVLGSPSKDPRYKTYTAALHQLQCVIDDTRKAIPVSALLRPGNESLEATPTILKNMSDRANSLTNTANSLTRSFDGLSSDCSAGVSATGDPRLSAARAALAVDREQAIAATVATLPPEIVGAVHAIHYQTLAAVASSIPDISTIKISSSKSASPSAAPASAKANGRLVQSNQISSVETNIEHPPRCSENTKILADELSLRANTEALNGVLEGTVLPAAHFAECITATDSSAPTPAGSTPTTSTGSGPAPAAKSAASPSTPFTILPSKLIYVKANQPQTIAINGGQAPFFVETVDPDVAVNRKPASGGVLQLELSLVNGTKSARVLFGDLVGNEEAVTLELVR